MAEKEKPIVINDHRTVMRALQEMSAHYTAWLTLSFASEAERELAQDRVERANAEMVNLNRQIP